MEIFGGQALCEQDGKDPFSVRDHAIWLLPVPFYCSTGTLTIDQPDMQKENGQNSATVQILYDNWYKFPPPRTHLNFDAWVFHLFWWVGILVLARS